MKEVDHFVEYIIALVSVEDMKGIASQALDEVKQSEGVRFC